MKMNLSDRANNLSQGAIRAFSEMARKIDDVVLFSIGEPDMDTPQGIIEAGCKALHSGYTHYTANLGLAEYREGVVKYVKEKTGVEYQSNEVMATVGGMNAVYQSLLAVVNPGDEVLVQDPQWLNHCAQIRLTGGVPVPVRVYEKDNWNLMPEDIERCITPKTKAIIINTPNNPTGAVLSEKVQKEIAQIVSKHNLFVILDEVYNTLIYDEPYTPFLSLPGMAERTLALNSFSKSMAMTGWRIGYVCAPRDIMCKLEALQENIVSCAPAVCQYAAIEALSSFDRYSSDLRDIFRKRRDFMYEGINSIKGLSSVKPKGAFYLFANIKELGKTSQQVCEDILHKHKVCCIPGSAFGEGGEGYIRIAYTLNEDRMKTGIERIREYVNTIIK